MIESSAGGVVARMGGVKYVCERMLCDGLFLPHCVND